MTADVWGNVLRVQSLGVSLALVGLFAWLLCVKERPEKPRDLLFLFIPFIFPYATWLYAEQWFTIPNPYGFTWNGLTTFMCYIDVMCLTFLVLMTGGTRDVPSIFTPLFVIVPPISGAYIWNTELGFHVVGITAIAIAGYALTFWKGNNMEIKNQGKLIYKFCVLGVVLGSIGLATWASAIA